VVELVRFSGHRLQRDLQEKKLTQEQMAYKWASLRFEVQKYVPLLQGLDIGYYLDDGDKQTPPFELLMAKLQNGEVYFIYSKQEFVGIAAITDIMWDRNAYIEGFAHPNFRGKHEVGAAIGELITYSFNEYGDGGLGLKKLKALVVAENIAGMKKAAKVGFKPAGILRGENLHLGVPHDVVLLELLNPKYFAVDTKVLTDARSTETPSVSHDKLHDSAAVGPGAGEYPAGDDANPDRAGGSSIRTDDAAMAATDELQPDSESSSTGRTGGTIRPATDAADAELVSAERDSTASQPTISPIPKPRRRVRVNGSGNGGTNGSVGTAAGISSSTSG
jgi:RimJ/RimL family protein N-acetyltransferase